MKEKAMSQSMESNPYLPWKAEIIDTTTLAPGTVLFKIRSREPFHATCGQFMMVSTWGSGEIPISVASRQADPREVELCIRDAGRTSGEITRRTTGDTLWIRGPYGNGFPAAGDGAGALLLVAGGVGIAPLRPCIQEYRGGKDSSLALVYGARTPGEILFRDEVETWKDGGIEVILTVDRGDGDWTGQQGLVTEYLPGALESVDSPAVFICGPAPMVAPAIHILAELGVPEEKIFVSMEAHMKCGIGKCGHCYAGGHYLCTDGPVFTGSEIRAMGAVGK